MEPLRVTSPAFSDGGWIPLRYTARGEDLSPALLLSGLLPGAVTLAVTLDDASHPLFPNYNHWLIWNLPPQAALPEAIPAGAQVPALAGAIQGVAYGKHRYKGPKPPLRSVHTYVWTVYALDCALSLPPATGKQALLSAMEGHILQQGTLTGKFQSHRRDA